MKKGMLLMVLVISQALAVAAPLRPPAVPLVACDPYFSIWSPADKLNEADTIHWTGKPHRLSSLVRIDGQAFRIMGTEPTNTPALKQTKLTVLPTRTIYEFEDAGIALTLTFLTPALPDDIDLLSRPVIYLTWDVHATDDKQHRVELYMDASGELAVNHPTQPICHAEQQTNDLHVLKMGSAEQPILAKKGDDLRIDWGYLYLASPNTKASWHAIANPSLLHHFVEGSLFNLLMEPLGQPGKADNLIAVSAFDLGNVGAQPVSRWIILAYDDIYSIQYFKQNLRPYWRRNGWEAADLLKAAAKDYELLQKRCAAFDAELMADMEKIGGADYAQICALAYRQTWAGCKIAADANGQPLIFPKENHSNGCVGTVDVIYPMAPQFLLFGPSLTKAILVQNLDYGSSPRWRFPYAPHDLGRYPLANGQVYGGGERTEDRQMPVEESGNMLVLLAALAQMEGNADFAGKYWPLLEKWAAYLKEKGFDPENQLCTDDFAGHLAHNVNLSAKAICGLASFARLCEMRGEKVKAAEFQQLAKDFAARWAKEAADGDHTKLAFDKPGSWSQKYNAVWDRILGFGLWPAAMWRKEMDFYRRTQKTYGLPLDSRKEYTKLDWTLWTATLTQERADFEALVAPVLGFINTTPNRSPLTDWYFTDSAKKKGFTARPVVGGVFLQALYDQALWKKWANRDTTKAANWAPLPKTPVTTVVVPTAREAQKVAWHYTTRQPAADWFKLDFTAAGWKQGAAAFGTIKNHRLALNTPWKTSDIWLRREFELPEIPAAQLALLMYHDEDAEVYLNGVLAAQVHSYNSDYDVFELSAAAKATLKAGKNLIALHCHQATGGQYIDAGLIRIEPPK